MTSSLLPLYAHAENYFFKALSTNSLDLSAKLKVFATGIKAQMYNLVYVQNSKSINILKDILERCKVFLYLSRITF